jgi:hypothetical protein
LAHSQYISTEINASDGDDHDQCHWQSATASANRSQNRESGSTSEKKESRSASVMGRKSVVHVHCDGGHNHPCVWDVHADACDAADDDGSSNAWAVSDEYVDMMSVSDHVLALMCLPD